MTGFFIWVIPLSASEVNTLLALSRFSFEINSKSLSLRDVSITVRCKRSEYKVLSLRLRFYFRNVLRYTRG